jgi:hypothetical protein
MVLSFYSIYTPFFNYETEERIAKREKGQSPNSLILLDVPRDSISFKGSSPVVDAVCCTSRILMDRLGEVADVAATDKVM